MPGQIDLSSVIAMMNQAAGISEREANAAIDKVRMAEPTQVNPIKTPTEGKKKLDDAEQPIKSLSSNMNSVNPEAQVIQLMQLDAQSQNYAMQVFDLVNTRNS